MRRSWPLLIALAGCADPGDEWFAGWDTCDSATGGYEFRYLSPPFERQEDVPEGQCHLTVESTHDNNIPAGLPELPPSYEVFTQALPPGAPDAYALGKQTELLYTMGHTAMTPVAPCVAHPCAVETRGHLAGYEIYTVDPYVRYHRYVYLGLPTGAVVEARIEANDDPHMRDVDDLVASFAAY